MITLNGTLKFRGKKFPIYWTGQHAQHISEAFMNESHVHPFLHIEIQQMLQTCKIFNKNVGFVKTDTDTWIAIPFQIISNFAVIKSAYITSR